MITLSNAGARVDLQIRKGGAFARTLTYKVNGAVQNISGYTFAAQVRTVSGTLAATFTCAIVSAAAGTFSIALTSAETAALVTTTEYKWDLEVTISGVVTELLRGDVSVVDEVTT
jgi:hypothetical protein